MERAFGSATGSLRALDGGKDSWQALVEHLASHTGPLRAESSSLAESGAPATKEQSGSPVDCVPPG